MIKTQINQEIQQGGISSNWHVSDVYKHLIEPIQESYIDSFDQKKRIELWTVFEEIADRSGYKIVYNSENNSYGLGITAENDDLMFIGYYGSFIETFNAM